MQRYKQLLPLIVWICLVLGSCRGLLEVVDPDIAYENKQYSIASDLYIEKFDKTSNRLEKADLAVKIADCYRLSNKTKAAESWYEKAMESSTDPLVAFQYALMQKGNEKYNDAIRTFKAYAYNNPSERARAQLQIQSCQLAQEWKAENNAITVVNIEQINSAKSDYAPVLFKENQLVFTSDREGAIGKDIYGWTGEKFSDIFICDKKDDRNYAKPVLFSDTLNTVYNEGTATFNADFTEMYFTRCGNPLEENAFCNIFYSKINKSGNWSRPEMLELFDESEVNVAQPFLSPNGSVLYFSSDAEGGYGDKDLYAVRRNAQGWGYPANLGPEINTDGYEGFPFIHSNGLLYFASNGHQGMGGLDVFEATRKGKRWGNPTNMKYPINSAADDFALIFDPYVDPEKMDDLEATAYISSTRTGGKGGDDIYRLFFEIPQEEELVEIDSLEIEKENEPEQMILLQGTVEVKKYADSEDPNSKVLANIPKIDAIVEILGLQLGSRVNERLITDENGNFELILEEKEEYKVSVSANQYFKKAEIITSPSLSDSDEEFIIVKMNILLEKIFEEREIVVDNIYYDLDSDQIRADALPVLNEIAMLLKENPSISLEFGAHTDSRGQKRYNEDLSQRRAQSVVNYLVEQSIAQSRLRAKGYGETQLVNACADGVECTEEQHQENRRTTFKVLSR